MKLGIIQTDPTNPKTLKIVNQDTGELLEQIMSYEIYEQAGDCQFLTVKVITNNYKNDTNVENYK